MGPIYRRRPLVGLSCAALGLAAGVARGVNFPGPSSVP
ncbi:hypothetical protein C4K26_4061 [Pseudomonas chlororaphis]|nr:hypothetical protein C4K26_4061 [Pseudomonas chlororaphis]